MVRDKILLRRRVNPKRADLPDGRTFYARYERVSRKNLPANVTVKKARTIGLRRRHISKQQQGSRILETVFNVGKMLFKSSYITKAFGIGSKAAKLAIGQKIIEEGIKQTLAIYKTRVKWMQSKKTKNILESDLANYAVKNAHKKLYNWQNA